MRIPPRSLLLLALIVFGPTACRDHSAPASSPRSDGHEHAEVAGPTNPGGRVEISPVVRSNLGITFAKVERRHVSRTLRVPGRLELLPTAKREYRVTMRGHVELLVDQYDDVEQGEPLFRVRSPQWAALQGEMNAADQAVVLAEHELRVADATVQEALARLELLQSRLTALTVAEIRRADLELQAAEAEASLGRIRVERDLAEARLTTARQSRTQSVARAAAALNLSSDPLLEQDAEAFQRIHTLDFITIIAAETGVVESIAVTNGAYAEDFALVLTIVQPHRVRFRGSIVQSDVARIGSQPPGMLVPPQSVGATPPEQVHASVHVGLEGSPNQRTVDVVAAPREHREWMRPGVSAFLEVVIDGTDRPELAIPRSALMKDGLKHVFFRRDPRDPNAAIRIEADLGPDDGRWVAIRSGLRLGDEVVLDGAYELMLATAQSGAGMKGGHFHPDGTWHAEH